MAKRKFSAKQLAAQRRFAAMARARSRKSTKKTRKKRVSTRKSTRRVRVSTRRVSTRRVSTMARRKTKSRRGGRTFTVPVLSTGAGLALLNAGLNEAPAALLMGDAKTAAGRIANLTQPAVFKESMNRSIAPALALGGIALLKRFVNPKAKLGPIRVTL